MTATAHCDIDPRPLMFGAGALVLVAMIASFTPTPLYPLYQSRWGLGDTQVSFVFAGYPIGVVLVLIGLGGLSDRIGRRPTLLIGLGVLVAAMVTLGFAGTLPALVAGRVLQGAGAGLIISAAAAALMESHPAGPHRGSFVNTACVSIGVAIGPFVAGAVAAATPRPLLMPYLLIVGVLVLPLLLLLRSTRERPGFAAARLMRAVRVPRQILRPFSVAAVAGLSTNLCLGLYGAFGPLVAHRVGWTSEAATGRLVSLTLVAVALAQVAGQWLSRTSAIMAGVVLAALGWVTTAAGVAWVQPVPVAIGSFVLGLGAGLCLLGGASLVGMIAPPGRSAEIYSAFLLIAFSTLAATVLVTGPALARWPLTHVLVVAAGVATLLVGYVVPGARRIARDTAEKS